MVHFNICARNVTKTKKKAIQCKRAWTGVVFLSVIVSREEQGWRSGESTRLPPMWPGFESWRRRHMWVEFVVGSLPCSERFFSGYSGFPLSSKTNISKFQFDQESGRRRTIMWMCYLQIVIYFIYLPFSWNRNLQTALQSSTPWTRRFTRHTWVIDSVLIRFEKPYFRNNGSCHSLMLL